MEAGEWNISLLPGISSRDSLPPRIHIRTTRDEIAIANLKKLLRIWQIINIHQREFIASHILLLPENNLVNIQLRIEAVEQVIDNRLDRLKTFQPSLSVSDTQVGMGNETYFLKSFWLTRGEAYASQLAFSTESHWLNFAAALRSDGSGTSFVPWSAYFSAI